MTTTSYGLHIEAVEDLTFRDTRIVVSDTTGGHMSPLLWFNLDAWQELVVDRIKAGADSPCVYGPDDVTTEVPPGGVAMVWSAVDRSDDDLATVVFTAEGWAAFTAGVRAGEFDVDRLLGVAR